MEEDRFDEKNQGLNEGYTGAGQEQDTPAVDSYGQGGTCLLYTSRCV